MPIENRRVVKREQHITCFHSGAGLGLKRMYDSVLWRRNTESVQRYDLGVGQCRKTYRYQHSADSSQQNVDPTHAFACPAKPVFQATGSSLECRQAIGVDSMQVDQLAGFWFSPRLFPGKQRNTE
jgi:hypothetical protein